MEWRTWVWTTALALALGLLAILIYAGAASPGEFASVFAFGSITALASFGVGAVPGLLFGVPRSRGESDEDEDASDHQARFVRNSNLVDVSDWLTKILVGVGLTQLGSAPDLLSSVGDFLAPGFGGNPSSAAFGVGVFLYFVVSAFLISYLMTSRYLAWLLDKGTVRQLRDQLQETRRTLRTVEDEKDAALQGKSHAQLGEIQAIEKAALEAVTEAGTATSEDDLRAIAREIERLFRLPSGTERTRLITGQTAQAMAATRQRPEGVVDLDEVRGLHSDGVGGAIVAMSALRAATNPQPDAIDIVLESVEHSQSAYEQYEALKALENLAEVLDRDSKQRACAAIADQRSGGEGKWITPGTDRWALSRSVATSLECEQPSSGTAKS